MDSAAGTWLEVQMLLNYNDVDTKQSRVRPHRGTQGGSTPRVEHPLTLPPNNLRHLLCNRDRLQARRNQRQSHFWRILWLHSVSQSMICERVHKSRSSCEDGPLARFPNCSAEDTCQRAWKAVSQNHLRMYLLMLLQQPLWPLRRAPFQ